MLLVYPVQRVQSWTAAVYNITRTNIPVLTSFLISAAGCVVVCFSVSSMLWLCYVCVDFVLVCAVFQWYLILGGAVFLMATNSAQTPPGGAREQTWFHSFQVLKSHFSNLVSLSLQLLSLYFGVCVFGPVGAPTSPLIPSSFSLTFSCLCAFYVIFLPGHDQIGGVWMLSFKDFLYLQQSGCPLILLGDTISSWWAELISTSRSWPTLPASLLPVFFSVSFLLSCVNNLYKSASGGGWTKEWGMMKLKIVCLGNLVC